MELPGFVCCGYRREPCPDLFIFMRNFTSHDNSGNENPIEWDYETSVYESVFEENPELYCLVSKSLKGYYDELLNEMFMYIWFGAWSLFIVFASLL